MQERPDFVVNFKRPKNTEIKRIKNNWYLYERTTVYDPVTQRPKKKSGSILGKITPDGLIPSTHRTDRTPVRIGDRYPHLLTPIMLGNVLVKNRIFMPPLSTNLADHGYVTDALVAHYAARAQGGVGLIITEVTTVEPTYCYLPGDMSIADDSYIPGWTKLVSAVHAHGCKILPQLFHPAFMAFPLPGTPQLIAPSAVGPYYAKEAPRPVTKEELHVLVKQFGDAAMRVQQAGADGVEIHAAHAHGLLGGFLSPLYNKRTDEYGGDINGRLRLTLEVVKEVRQRCGPDFVIDVRLSGDEYTDGGLNLNDMTYAAKCLEKAGVDFLHISGGTTIMRGSAIPAPGTPMGSHSALSEEIRKQVNIPVSTVGRITEPWLAEELIANQKADICMIGRANLCDPNFVHKMEEKQEEDIRPCIGCLRCLNGIMFGKPVACTMNPAVGPDNEETLTPVESPKNVLVIGGGPGGMEAAYTAARRGHRVVLCESSDSLGGQMRLAAVPIAKQDLARAAKYMIHKVESAGVRILLNTPVTKELIRSDFRDCTIIAAPGAKPIVPDFLQGFKQTVTADDILAGRAFPGRKVVVVGGGAVGCETADYLAPLVNDLFPRNREIIVLEMAPGVMLTESGPGRSKLVQRMMRKGVQLICGAKVTEVSENAITYVQNGENHSITDADTLVVAVGYRPDPAVEEMLRATGLPYRIIGDGVKEGNMKDAISQGYQAGKEI